MTTTGIIQPPQIGCAGENITTNTDMTVMEMKRKRGYKRKDCGGDTNIEKKKRKDCGGDTNTEKKKRKDCGDTSTVMETKKRAYTRKDCTFGTNTPTVVETNKKRAYRRKNKGLPHDLIVDETKLLVMEPKKRKDCEDTNTSTVMEPKKRKDCGDASTVIETKKRAYRRKDCVTGSNTPTLVEINKKRAVTEKKKRAFRSKKCLPHDLIVDEILTRLPVPTLLLSALVSKLWCHSIHNDHKRFTRSHFLQSQKHPQVVLSLLNVRQEWIVKEGIPTYGCHFFKMYDREYENDLQFDKSLGGVVGRDRCEMVGYCHGLPCIAAVNKYSAATAYMISDPNRKDFLLIYPASRSRRITCHGFGFDRSANEYKLVSIFRTFRKELNFVVYTLGTKSWRNITATISGHGDRPVTKIRAPTGSDKSAIYCATGGGCLVWKIIATLGGVGSNDLSNAVSNEVEMLLSFNLRDEKFQFIQLPANIQLPAKISTGILVDYPHLLEFKGSPCIARVEKTKRNVSDYPHRCCGDHQGSSSNSCCCCCKIHLYVMKDTVKHVWVKEESFDVRINSIPTCSTKMEPEPCCFCFGSATTLPTRIYSFSDQMLLYWFKGKYLQVYNLRSEKLQLVRPFHHREDVLFRAKIEEPRHIYNSGDNAFYSSNLDYQLHCHEENFASLQTFIPEGIEGIDADDFSKLDLEPCLGYMFIYRRSKVYYPFF